jgi:tight adherence protein B
VGALVGLLFGLGCLLVWRSGSRAPVRGPRGESWEDRTRDLLIQAGIEGVSPRQLLGVSIGLGFVVFVLVLGTSQVPVIALLFGGFAGCGPLVLVRRRRSQRTMELREVWPEAVDNLASGVRAGLSLPEALSQLGHRGPEQLRSAFRRFGEDYRATGRFGESIDSLKRNLADPVATGWSSRCGWPGGRRHRPRPPAAHALGLPARGRPHPGRAGDAAGLDGQRGAPGAGGPVGAAAPAVHPPERGRGLQHDGGALVLLIGGAVSVAAYRVMIRIARLPTERRVLR